jgi:hypothetical protein
MVTAYKIFKYLPLSFEEFYKISKEKGKATTKNDSKDKNVCMITNAGMKVLRKETLEKFGDSYQERLDKPLFYYDVDALKTVFYTLSEFQKEGR